MIGFDNIELSMQLLAKRQDAVTALTNYTTGRGQESQPPQPRPSNGKSKGKQTEGLQFPAAGCSHLQNLQPLPSVDRPV